MSSPVSWDVAERVGVWVSSGKLKAISGSQLTVLDPRTQRNLESDFARFTEQAEDLVVRATGLVPPTGPPCGMVVDRADWVRANIRSFRRLLSPLLDKLEQTQMPRTLSSVSGAVTGSQLGFVIGWMSTRVLGQYDILFTEDSASSADATSGDGSSGAGTGGDIVSYVGPNIVGLERRHGFPPEQFRLWIALHEVTHRCQFTGVPWLHEYFLSLVEEGLSGMTPDPKRFTESLRHALDEIRAGRNPLEQSGIIGLIAAPEQLATIGKIQALMSLLEGHGDITMNRAGVDLVPEADRFAKALRERRKRAGPAARLMQQLIGMDAKLRQYEQGERFIEAVEASGGPELLAKVWVSPDRLPTLDEIREPAQWIARMNSPQLVAGVTDDARVVDEAGVTDRTALSEGEKVGQDPRLGDLASRCDFPAPGQKITCAVSGGADSLALLVLATSWGCDVTAVHVDHGLRAGSGDEAHLVERAAAKLGAKFESFAVEVGPGANLEARARDARRSALPAGSSTGHTMDDQAETVIIRLLRGTGPDGLAAMRPGREHPMLRIRRTDTREVARQAGLAVLEDPSNLDPSILRNRVRHELIPLCSQLVGRDVVPLLARLASLAADDADFLGSLADELDPADAGALGSAPLPLARRAVRSWLRADGPYPPDLAAVERVLEVARGEVLGTEVAPNMRVRRTAGRLRIEDLPARSIGQAS